VDSIGGATKDDSNCLKWKFTNALINHSNSEIPLPFDTVSDSQQFG